MSDRYTLGFNSGLQAAARLCRTIASLCDGDTVSITGDQLRTMAQNMEELGAEVMARETAAPSAVTTVAEVTCELVSHATRRRCTLHRNHEGPCAFGSRVDPSLPEVRTICALCGDELLDGEHRRGPCDPD